VPLLFTYRKRGRSVTYFPYAKAETRFGWCLRYSKLWPSWQGIVLFPWMTEPIEILRVFASIRRANYNESMRLTNASFSKWVTLATLLMILLYPGGMHVVCVGENGHRAIEAPHPTSPCDGVKSSAPAPDETPRLNSGSGGCVDVPLSAELNVPRPNRQGIHRMTFPTAYLLYRVRADDLFKAKPCLPLHPLDTPDFFQHARSLRSTVLLT